MALAINKYHCTKQIKLNAGDKKWVFSTRRRINENEEVQLK